MLGMAKRKLLARDGADREPAASAGRRKRMVLQLSDAIAAATAALAEEWDCKPTELVNRAMREFLEREAPASITAPTRGQTGVKNVGLSPASRRNV